MLETMLTMGQAVAGDASAARVWAYGAFLLLVLAFLALDLGVFHREAHEVSMKEATIWSCVWLACGVAFAGFVWAAYDRQWLGLGVATAVYNPDQSPGAAAIVLADVPGREAAKQYLTGYLVEKSLAMDNIFVIALIFSYFAVPARYQHRVLFWGIVGALVMRGGLIFAGASLVMKYTWVLIIFGVFLVLTAAKMALIKGNDDPSQNAAVRLLRKFVPVTEFYDGQRFFTRRTKAPTYERDGATDAMVMRPPVAGELGAAWRATPLFLALVLVEVTDLVFAVDSIPAIFAITPDPFIVFTSNIFAILGLRSLYFCLAAAIAKFSLLKPALIVILAFVGVKLLLLAGPPYLDDIGRWFGATWHERPAVKIPTGVSMGVVAGVLGGAVLGSWAWSRLRRASTREVAG